MIDVNKDGLVDFNEFLVVVVLINRLNDLGSRLSFVFDMYRFLIVCKIFFYFGYFQGGMNQMMEVLIKKNWQMLYQL
jgi:hypothetical protein